MPEVQILIHPELGAFQLEFRPRKTMGITVQPTGDLHVAAPQNLSELEIQKLLWRRRSWIRTQRRRFEEMATAPALKRYVTGATHRYLGKQYRLKITQAAPESVKLCGAFFVITANSMSPAHVENLLNNWYRTHALKLIERKIARCSPWVQRNQLPQPRPSLRSMPSRWGSAQPDGRIFFNPILIRTPGICIDYVVAHELCHLKFRNHSTAFYRELGRLFPLWEKAKAKLESFEL